MTSGNTPMTGAQLAQAGLAMAGSIAPLLPPNVGIAVTIANQLYLAAMQAFSSGADMTDEQLDAALDADAAEKVLDAASEKAAAAEIAAGTRKA